MISDDKIHALASARIRRSIAFCLTVGISRIFTASYSVIITAKNFAENIIYTLSKHEWNFINPQRLRIEQGARYALVFDASHRNQKEKHLRFV